MTSMAVSSTPAPTLARRAFAEFLGAGLLVTVIVGSGIAAARLSPDSDGVSLLINAAATAAGLAVIILLVGPVSGAHVNPAVSLADAALGRRRGTGLTGRELGAYLPAQVTGGVAGCLLANLMYDLPAVSIASTERSGAHLLLAEVVATAGLVALVFVLARTGRTTVAPAAIGAYIGAAMFVTSSTAFANPAVSIGRLFTDTFTGIAAHSVPGFVLAQLVGTAAGVVLVLALYPTGRRAADDAVMPHPSDLRRGS